MKITILLNTILHSKKLTWDNLYKNSEYISLIESQLLNLGNIVTSIKSNKINIDDGIDQFSSILYDNAFKIFG